MSRVERLITTPQPLVTEVASQQDIASVAKQTAYDFEGGRYRHGELKGALCDFLQAVYQRPEPQEIAFLDRREEYMAPILEVYLLWDRPILGSDSCQLREVTADHNKFVKRINPTLDSLLYLVDPLQYPSPDRLETDLSILEQSTSSPHLLRFVRLKK